MEDPLLTSASLLKKPLNENEQRRGPLKKSNSAKNKTANRLFNKLNHLKNATRLLTCEFDEHLLQLPAFLAPLTSKLQSGWQSSTVSEEELTSPLPPLIRPMEAGQKGTMGAVPLSHSFTWTRAKPQLIEAGGQESDVILTPVSEPEVLLLLTSDQIKNLTKASRSSSGSTYSTLNSFGTTIKQLARPVTCVLVSGAGKSQAKKRRTSIDVNKLSINQLCTQLQLVWGVQSTRVCNSMQDAALLVASYTQSIAERPFKEGRLSRDEGLGFLPDAVRMGLTGCASRGRGAGPAPNLSNAITANDGQAVRSWANRVWLSQLGQWRGLTGEIAHSITLVYPTARVFFDACQSDKTEEHDEGGLPVSTTTTQRKRPFQSTLADLEIRRGAGLLATKRRLGPEFARRLITHFTNPDPSYVIE